MGKNLVIESMSANYSILQNCGFKGVKLFGKWQKNCFFSAYPGFSAGSGKSSPLLRKPVFSL
jgi:hypothetical protein